jgi:hypothetical protein
MEQLKALMRFKPTKADAAAVMKCSEDTLERRIRETFNQTYIEFQEQHKAPVKIKLRQLALDKALKGDDYWLTKCNEEFGWFTKKADPNVQVNVQNNVNVTVDVVDLEDRIKLIKGEEK